MKSFGLSISKTKQIFHAYFPLVFIVLFPKSFLGVILALAYVVLSGYVYLNRSSRNYPEESYEYYLINVAMTVVIIGLHVNAL